ncbi:MAG: galactose oxidase [Bacteroidota bacterium]
MKLSLAFCTSILLLFACQPSDQQVDQELTQGFPGQWEAIESSDGSQPVARHEAAYLKVNEAFYLLGGRGIKPVNRFDPRSKTWSEGASTPIEMHHMQPVVWQNKIYVLCALTGPYPGETPIPNVYIYDPATNQWSIGPEIPEARRRGAAGVVVYENKMYISCGIKDGHRGDHKNWLDVFDPETESWDTLTNAPRARDHFQAIAANDKMYLLGGRRSSAPDNVFGNLVPEVDVYDFHTGSWSTLKDTIPHSRAGNYVARLNDAILVLGGETTRQEAAHAEVDALSLMDQSWSAYAPMMFGRHGTGAIVHEGSIYVASGSGNRGGGPELKTQERFTLE